MIEDAEGGLDARLSDPTAESSLYRLAVRGDVLNNLLRGFALGCCVLTVLTTFGSVSGFLDPLHHPSQFATNFLRLADHIGRSLHQVAELRSYRFRHGGEGCPRE